MKRLDEFIYVARGCVPKQLCEAIIEEYKNDDSFSDVAHVNGAYSPEVRKCEVNPISTPAVIEKNPQVRSNIDAALFNYIHSVTQEYQRLFPRVVFNRDTGYDLLRYRAGDYIRDHIDAGDFDIRVLSCSVQLNSDFQGGKWSFFDGELDLEVGTGDIIVFPSNFMFPHEVTEITEGTRYSIITWMLHQQ